MDPEYFQLNRNTSLMRPATETGHLSPTEEQWLQYKDTIQYQYLMCNMPLEELVKFLSRPDFFVTKAQLEYKLKKWGFSKSLGKSTWQYIDRKITKRKREGKDTDIIHSGKRLKQSAINKAINRHRETAIFAQIAQSRSPPPSPTNPYLTVCTPPYMPMEFDKWPASLPWLKFEGTYLALARSSLGLETSCVTSNVIPRTMPAQLLKLTMGHRITQIQESGALKHLSNMATHIGKTMPEWYEGEHLQTTQTLLHCPGKDAIPHCLKLIIYQISNGFLENLKYKDACEEVHDLLIGLGILDLQIDLKRLHVDDITIRAFMENLFQYAIHWATHERFHSRRNLNLIRWLLSSGLDPNNEFKFLPRHLNWRSDYGVARPIQLAVESGHTELVELLLSFGADISDRSNSKTSTMDLTLHSINPGATKYRIIELLVRHGVSINLDERLYGAIQFRDLDSMRDILKLVVDPTKAMKVHHDLGPLFEETALSAAIKTGSGATDVVLNHFAFLDPSQLEAPFVTADTFIAAAMKGDDATILRLHEISPTTGCTRNQRGIKPVEVAVSSGHLSTCQLLLRLYNGYSPALLFLAAFENHENILQFLLQEGADANATIDADDCSECERVCSSFTGAFNSQSSPSTFRILLDIARNRVIENSLHTLIEGGAQLTGGEVWQFAAYESHETLLAALKAGGSPNERDNSGKSALQHAIDSIRFHGGSSPYPHEIERRFRVVQTLLHYGAELLGGELVSAIRYRDLDLVALIANYCSDLKDTDEYGTTSLEGAIAFSNHDILLQVAEAYNGHYDPGSLCAAAQAGKSAICDMLLTNRPVQSDCHFLEGTAVGLIAMSGDLNYLQKVLQHLPGASEPSSALIPICLDAEERITGEVFSDIHMFWRVPEVTFSYVYGSPLAIASHTPNTSGFEKLLSMSYQADILTWTNIAHNQSFPHLELLAKYQQRLDAFLQSPPEFSTPLSIAVRRQNKELVDCLLCAGADINEYGRHRSPLQLSVELGNLELISYLLQRGANVNAPPAADGGATALQLAAIGGHLGIARELIDRGARINARGAKQDGRTALEGAAEHGRIDMLEYLIHHGALITGNGRGQFLRAVEFAMSEGFHAAAGFLKRRGDWTEEDERRFTEGWRFSYPSEPCCDELHDPDSECFHESFDSEKETFCFRFMEYSDDRDFPAFNVNWKDCYDRYETRQCSDSDCVLCRRLEPAPESELGYEEEDYGDGEE